MRAKPDCQALADMKRIIDTKPKKFFSLVSFIAVSPHEDFPEETTIN